MDHSIYIIKDPEIRFGKPTIKGTRISVADVIGWMASGLSEKEILEDFPELTPDQINACLAFESAQRELRL